MSEPVILVEKLGEVAIVTLNRPNAMNALSRDLRAAIATTSDAPNPQARANPESVTLH